VADGARAGDRRAATVGHDAEAVLLGLPDLGLAVARIAIAPEAVLGVPHAVPGHLGAVGVGEPGLEDDRAGVDLHPVGMEAAEARTGVGAWIGQPAGDQRYDVDESQRRHESSPRRRSTMAFALVQS